MDSLKKNINEVKSTVTPASVSVKGAAVQSKISIGSVDDPQEKEADSIADKVMRMPEAGVIQRSCAGCDSDEMARRTPLASFIQRKSVEGSNIASDQVSDQILSTKGGGRQLPDSARSFMESRFGTQFSDIRVHTGSYATELSDQLNAQAFTVEKDIYFNEGKFSPDSAEGKQLLAHELTHTIQQKKNDALPALSSGHIQKAPVQDIGSGASAAGSFNPLTGLYTVGKGDKLANIASRFGIPIERILKSNPEITNVNKVFVGQKIFIPDLIMPKDPVGDVSATVTFDDYVKKWEAEKGRKITSAEKLELERGCVGISSIHIGADPLDKLDRCYDSFENSLRLAREDNEKFRKTGLEKKKKSVIFSMRFWSGSRPYAPDRSGKVDMTDYDSRLSSGDAWKPKPGGGGYTNFDFGYYDETTGMWWHANHSQPGMEIYESTLEHYSRRLQDFDRQIFCVSVINLK